MKFGPRKPSLNKRIAARTSFSRYVRHSLGFKAPRGFGWLTNPKRAAYNRVYNRTTFKADGLIVAVLVLIFAVLGGIVTAIASLFSRSAEEPTPNRRRGWLWAAAAAVTVFVVLHALGSSGPSAVDGAGHSSEPSGAELILISIAGIPPSAKIVVDGELEPPRFSLPRTTGKHDVEISCSGYVTYDGTFDASRNADLVVTLVRANARRRKRPPSTRRPVGQSSAAEPADDHMESPHIADDGGGDTPGPAFSGARSTEPSADVRRDIPNSETVPAANAPTPAQKQGWVDPFEDDQVPKSEDKTKWVDPFAQ